MTMRRILVTGSRNWDQPDVIYRALSDLALDGPALLVHGGASGADQIAGRAARQLGWEREIHPARWRANGIYNPQAGLLRNRHMVELGADLCLAFIKDGSRGATHCAQLAEQYGIPVRRFQCSSTP